MPVSVLVQVLGSTWRAIKLPLFGKHCNELMSNQWDFFESYSTEIFRCGPHHGPFGTGESGGLWRC